MSQDTETFNNELYDLLKVRGYKPVPLNSQNQRVGASQQADVIEFTFTKDGESYGKVWISADDASNLKVYFDDEQQDSPDTTTPGVDYDDTWTGLLKHLKKWAQRRQLSFELSNKDRLGDDMRQRDYYKMKEKLGEGYHAMGKKASYNDEVPNVKIVLQHNRALEEGEQRYRNVDRIFLENADGERFLAPTTRPGIARVYARHIAEGGAPNDDRWNHIKSVCEDYNKMAGFVRATRNKEFNESAQDLINEGANHYTNLRETLHKLTGHRGYHAYFESWTPSLMEDEGEDLAINELFVQETVDPRIENVMPILSKLRKKVAEMSETDTLAEWADSVINEKLELDDIEENFINMAPQAVAEEEMEEGLGDTIKKGAKSFKRGMQGWEKGMHDVETVKRNTASLTPDMKAAIAKKKVAGAFGGMDTIPKGSPAELQQKLINREKNKEVDEATGYYDKKHPQHDRMTKDGYEHSEDDIQGKKMHRYYKPGESLTDLYKYDDEKLDEVGDTDAGQEALAKTWRRAGSKAFRAKHAKDEYEHGYTAAQLNKEREKHRTVARQADERLKPETERFTYVKEEGLDANQKRVGQLGPTEKVKNNNIGKLVGANESTEIPEELARIMEMARFKR